MAREFGLSDGVIVAAGGGDNAASAIGIGATQPGDGFVSLGTSGVLCVVGDSFRPNPASAVHAFCHAIPDRWHQMSVVLSAASCLRWVCKLTSTDEPDPARRNRGAASGGVEHRPALSAVSVAVNVRRTTTRTRKACSSA